MFDENALKIANAGLDKSMEKFQFVPSKIQGGGNEPMTLQEAMDKFQGKEEYSFDTYAVLGVDIFSLSISASEASMVTKTLETP